LPDPRETQSAVPRRLFFISHGSVFLSLSKQVPSCVYSIDETIWSKWSEKISRILDLPVVFLIFKMRNLLSGRKLLCDFYNRPRLDTATFLSQLNCWSATEVGIFWNLKSLFQCLPDLSFFLPFRKGNWVIDFRKCLNVLVGRVSCVMWACESANSVTVTE
jgi:hypothetical protein